MAPEQSPWQWHGYCFRAMNSTVQLWLYSRSGEEALLDVQRLFNSFERRLSRFDLNSELSRLNNSTGAWFEASPTLIDAMEIALAGATASRGLYDPTVLVALEQAGYDRSFEQVSLESSPSPLSPPRPNWGDYRAVEIDRPRRRIYRRTGLRLDLGGMGKGWSVDRAADRLQGLGPFLINAGGDIFAYQAPPGAEGWQVDLVDPRRPETHFGRVTLRHRALATSTVVKRRWRRNGEIMHHLIDPRSGRPADSDALSVSVIADRTVLAEIYAKVALILGTEQGLAYLEQLPGVEGLIYDGDGQIHTSTGMAPYLTLGESAEAFA